MLLWLLSACLAPSVEVAFEGPQLTRTALTMQWRACPPSLPASCEMAVLEGDPSVSGKLFTTRLRVPAPFTLPPHRHPANERLTVLEGSISVSFGPTVDRARARHFEAGDYYVTARGEPHAVWSDQGATVQITGIGPWRVEPVTP